MRTERVDVATVELPSVWRVHVGGRNRVPIEASTVDDALKVLADQHPPLRRLLFLESGQLRRSIGLFVGEDDVRDGKGLATPLSARDVLVVLTAMAGG